MVSHRKRTALSPEDRLKRAKEIYNAEVVRTGGKNVPKYVTNELRIAAAKAKASKHKRR